MAVSFEPGADVFDSPQRDIAPGGLYSAGKAAGLAAGPPCGGADRDNGRDPRPGAFGAFAGYAVAGGLLFGDFSLADDLGEA